MIDALIELLADPRRDAVAEMATAEGIRQGESIPLHIWLACGYSEDELRRINQILPGGPV